jgi:hypothetical protein
MKIYSQNSDESKFRLSLIKVLVPRCRKPYYLHSPSQIYLSKHVYSLGIKIGSQVNFVCVLFTIIDVCRPKRTYYKSIIFYCTHLTCVIIDYTKPIQILSLINQCNKTDKHNHTHTKKDI